ncbi:MAG: tetratricopeptide repeat protein [Dysgonamonadaceae bacterium]|jgi:tetratricopeptide (TPR) repeat protein|nr:tetratricopeptide repeat protein [Dysgonamonadaceae bacterium]
MRKNIILIVLISFVTGGISATAQDQDSLLNGYLRKAQYRQAIEYIEMQTPSRDLTYQQSLCYKWLNNYPKAIEQLEILQEQYPDDIPIQLELAQCYEINLQYPQSIRCYENLIQADSANTYFRIRKADLLYSAERYSTALADYLQIDPDGYHPAYLKRSVALCYEKLNRPDSAQAYYLDAWNADRKDVFSALSLTKLCIRQENYLQALSYSETFLAEDTVNASMNALNAFCYYNLNNYEEAVRRFEKCLAAGDSSLMVNRSLGISYFFLKNDTAAYPFLQQAYKRDTTNATVLYALASVNYHLQQYPEAIRAYETLIERETPNPNALCTYYAGLAQSCEKDSLYHDAARNYLAATRYASSNRQKMELFFNLSVLLEFQLKDYKQAVFYYTQYQATLLNYQDALLEQTSLDPEEVREIEFKLDELNKHIRALKAEHEINYTDKIWNN